MACLPRSVNRFWNRSLDAVAVDGAVAVAMVTTTPNYKTTLGSIRKCQPSVATELTAMKRREDGGRASGLGLLPVVLVLLLSSVEAVAPGRFQFRRSIYTTTEDFGVAYVTGKLRVVHDIALIPTFITACVR